MRDFFKYTFASLLALLIFCGLGVGTLILLVVIAISSSNSGGPQVKDKSVLTFDLSLDITDTEPTRSTSRVLQEALSDQSTDRIALRAVIDSIDGAAQDKRIVALYLYGNLDSANSTGLATLKEVRQALERFRAAGKTIIAYDVNWREKEYYLGSVANTIILNPFGTLEMNGLRSQTVFISGALQKLGVGVQITRVGKYKSAVEPLLLTKNSPASREQTQKLLNDLWSEFLTTVGKNRNLTVPQLQKVADSQGILMADEALKQKLVDRVAYFDEVITDLKRLTENKDSDRTFRQISLPTYARATDGDRTKFSQNQVAVIYAQGEIVDGLGSSDEVGGDRLARQIRSLRLNDRVKAIVLRVNSPGGSVTASEVIQREVLLARKVKPVVVSMGDVAASGGYWISTYADRIFAEANTITGSIGVFGLLPNVEKLANRNGVTWDTVKTARYADSQTIARPRTPGELAINQKIVDRIYDRFLDKVAESRKLPRKTVAEIAQGRVWSGQTAKQIGLVDEIGGLESAIRAAAKRANLGDDWQVEEYPKTRRLEERLLESLGSGPASKLPVRPDPVTAELQQMWQDVAALRSLNDPHGIYARLPFLIRID